MQPRFDTSLRLMAELLRRGISVDFCDLTQADASRSTADYLNHIPVQSVKAADPDASSFLRLGADRQARVQDYAVILHRKDPPVDAFYKAHAQHYARAPQHIVHMNHPDQTWRYSEHALPCDYPQYSIPTFVCSSLAEFTRAVRAQPGEAVAKPENECSGVGVEFFKSDVPDATLATYWDKWKPEIIVQPFVDEITKSGDLRILTFNGKILGSVLRVARAGSRLANLHQGASWRAWEITPRQREAAEFIGHDLARKGLYLLGLDFIGERISEINITSPSAMVQINEVMGKRTEIELVNEIEALRFSKAHFPVL